MKDENDISNHKLNIETIQPFFQDSQTVQKKGPHHSNYLATLNTPTSQMKTPQNKHLNLPEFGKSANRRSKQLTTEYIDDEEEFKDAKSEMFYSINSKEHL